MCGVIGIYLKGDKPASTLIPSLTIDGLSMLQHRGQRSAGITVYNPQISGEPNRKVLVTHKEAGLVSEVFRLNHPPDYRRILERCTGRAAIGNTRYSTAGSRDDPYL